jgi:hypothetical protein
MSAMVLNPAPANVAGARARRSPAVPASAVPFRSVPVRSVPVRSVAGSSTVASVRAGGLRLTRRGRAVLVLLALALVAGAVLLAPRASAEGTVSAQEVQRHVVVPGETLWRIAADVTPAGQDVRDAVDRLVRLNHLPSASLMAGQVIVVPVG